MTLEELRNEFDRSVTDQIAVADRAQSVADAISETDPEQLQFRRLFYHLLTTQGDAVVLALGKLFDPPPRNYPTRSILGILSLLERNAETLTVYRRPELEEWITSETGRDLGIIEGLEAPDLVREFVSTYRAHFVGNPDTTPTDPPAILSRIRTRRNKTVAHNENWSPIEDEKASWQDGRDLLDIAKKFSGLVGRCFLDFHHEAQDGTYMLSKDSRMVGKQAERLIATVQDALRAGDVG